MNIGLFTDCYYPQINGVVTSVMILQQELTKRGHNVTIVTVDVPGLIEEVENVIRIKSIPFSKCKEFRLGLAFSSNPIKAIKALDLDIIHTHTEFSVGLLGRYMAKTLNIPIIHTYHTMYEDYSHYICDFKYGKNVAKSLIIKLSKLYLKKYNVIIAPTEKTKKALINYGVTKNIQIVPTGINIHSFNRHETQHPILRQIRRELNLEIDDKIILSLGRISQEKDVDTIIRQMVQLKSIQPAVKLIIVGDGPYKEKLKRLVSDFSLEDLVRFVGSVPFEEVSYYYSLAHLFISASRSETQGLTIAEAMASNLPVIVYDDDNIKDIIVDGYSGRLFKTEKELTANIVGAFNFPSKTKKMADNAYKTVQKLSKEAFGENVESVYLNIIGANLNRRKDWKNNENIIIFRRVKVHSKIRDRKSIEASNQSFGS